MSFNSKTSFTFNGGKLVGSAHRGSIDGVNLAIERLRGHSVEKAPVDAGDLRGSSSTVPATSSQVAPTAVLVFDEPYAAVQHEDETLNHTAGQHGEPAGEAHYVSSNYEDAARRTEYRDIIGRGIIDAVFN